jgi:hypothetical protein
MCGYEAQLWHQNRWHTSLPKWSKESRKKQTKETHLKRWTFNFIPGWVLPAKFYGHTQCVPWVESYGRTPSNYEHAMFSNVLTPHPLLIGNRLGNINVDPIQKINSFTDKPAYVLSTRQNVAASHFRLRSFAWKTIICQSYACKWRAYHWIRSWLALLGKSISSLCIFLPFKWRLCAVFARKACQRHVSTVNTLRIAK